MLKIYTAILPSHWASALINGDRSGLEPEDVAQLDQCLEIHPEWAAPVGCEDAGFKWSHDATPYGVLACDCQEYQYLMREDTSC